MQNVHIDILSKIFCCLTCQSGRGFLFTKSGFQRPFFGYPLRPTPNEHSLKNRNFGSETIVYFLCFFWPELLNQAWHISKSPIVFFPDRTGQGQTCFCAFLIQSNGRGEEHETLATGIYNKKRKTLSFLLAGPPGHSFSGISNWSEQLPIAAKHF